MRIVTWNIRHGGGNRIRAIMAELQKQNADVFVLTETRLTEPTMQLRGMLHGIGYAHQYTPGTAQKENSVLVASKLALDIPSPPDLSSEFNHRLQHCRWGGLNIVAVYFPAKRPGIPNFHAVLARHAREWLALPTVILGDFNSADSELDVESRPHIPSIGIRTLLAQGWTDAWRHTYPTAKEYTWFSNAANGFRIDAAFLSPGVLPSLVQARHEHDPRAAGTSDHSLLSLDLAWPQDAGHESKKRTKGDEWKQP